MALLAAVVMLAALPFRGQQLPATAKKPLLFLAEDDAAPLSYTENGVPKGRDVDFADALGRAMGRKVHVELTTWDEAQQRIQRGEADGLLSVSVSDQRKEVYELSDPAFLSRYGLFVPVGELRVHDLGDLAGGKLGFIGVGSIAYEFLSGRPDIRLVQCKNYEDAFGRLASRDVDAVVTEIWLGAYWLQQKKSRAFTLAGQPIATFPLSVALRKGDIDLVKEINRSIRTLKADGTISRIEAKWSPQEVLFLSRERVRTFVLWAVGTFAAVLVGVLTLWIVLLWRSIGKRKRVEVALQDSQANLVALLQSTRDMVWSVDKDYRLLTFNSTLAQHFRENYGTEARVGASSMDHLPPERAAKWPPLYERALIQGPFSQEYDLPDGRILELALHPILRNGEAVGVSVFGKDITGRKQAEAALQQSETRFRTLFEMASDAILIMNQQNRFADCNLRAETLFHCRRQDIVGHSPVDLSPAAQPDGRLSSERAAERIEAALGGQPQFFEWKHVRHDGIPFDAEVSLSRVITPDAEFLIAIVRDITERKRAEKEKQALQEQLLQAMKMEALGQLAGGVAHDFNNILTVISGYSSIVMESGTLLDSVCEDVKEISAASDRAASLTRQLLAFSRQQVLQPQIVNLNTTLDALAKMVRRLIGEDIEVFLRPAPGVGSVKADPGQLEQILLNLIVNARDAMPSGGKLTLETANVELDANYSGSHPYATPGRHVLLAVSDTGIGMDAATRSRIFEPFYTTKAKGKGTGLGLSTVYGIVKQSGGHIEVYSEPGTGTTFKIYLPRVDQPATSPSVSARAAVTGKDCETILLAEDDVSVRHLAQRTLAARGYTVLAPEKPEDAETLCRQHPGPIDLLLTDVIMPGIGGRELARRAALLRPEIRVLYMSGYTPNAIVHHGVLEEGLAFLPKPFTPATLTTKVREILDGEKQSPPSPPK